MIRCRTLGWIWELGEMTGSWWECRILRRMQDLWDKADFCKKYRTLRKKQDHDKNVYLEENVGNWGENRTLEIIQNLGNKTEPWGEFRILSKIKDLVKMYDFNINIGFGQKTGAWIEDRTLGRLHIQNNLKKFIISASYYLGWIYIMMY